MRPRNISAQRAKEYYYDKDPIFSKKNGISRWYGAGSEKLGLSGYVEKKHFLNIIAGNDPKGNQIIQDGVNGEHRACVDIPFSAPKSVSILALHAGENKLIEAHKVAIASTIQYIEKNYIYARRTTNGITKIERTGNGVFATYTHSTSRENDPQLHTHTLVMNMTKAGNGWRAVWNDQIFKDQTLLNSVYQSYLARNVKNLGYNIENKQDGTWEIAGVKQKWIDVFSKRSKAIDAKDNELIDRGKLLNDATRRNVAVLDSRPKKDTRIGEEVHSLWKSQVSPQKIKNSVNKVREDFQLESRPLKPNQYIDLAIKAIHETEATFKKKDVVNFALKLSRGETTVTDIERGFKSGLKEDKIILLKELENSKGRKIPIYSTPAMESAEKNVLNNFIHGKGKVTVLVNSDKVQDTLKQKYSHFTLGQANIVKHILTSKDQFLIVQGDAGTGKTSAMAAVKQIISKENQRSVQGLAFTGKAASELEDRAGFNSQTISGFLKNSSGNSSDLWIVDESSMVGTMQMSEVVDAANIQNAKVVFVGDGKQLQAISAGRMFKDLQENGHIKTVKMEEALRQKTEPMIKTVQYIKNFQEGKDNKGIDKAFRELQKAGNIIEVKDCVNRSLRVAKDYVAEGNIKETLILTSNNIARVEMNDLIREDLKQRGIVAKKDFSVTTKSPVYISGTDRYFADSYKVGQCAFVKKSDSIDIKAGKELKIVKCDTAKNAITVEIGPGKTEELDLKQDLTLSIYTEEDRKFSEGDKVVFLKNDKNLGVQNGLTGTIKDINSFGKMSVKIDGSDGSARIVGFHPDNYKYFDHGYAVTTTKSQGQTASKVLYMTDSQTGYANKTEHLYVAVSRAERNVKIYTDDFGKVKDQFKAGQNKTSVLQNRKKNTISGDTASPKLKPVEKFKGQEL